MCWVLDPGLGLLILITPEVTCVLSWTCSAVDFGFFPLICLNTTLSSPAPLVCFSTLLLDFITHHPWHLSTRRSWSHGTSSLWFWSVSPAISYHFSRLCSLADSHLSVSCPSLAVVPLRGVSVMRLNLNTDRMPGEEARFLSFLKDDGEESGRGGSGHRKKRYCKPGTRAEWITETKWNKAYGERSLGTPSSCSCFSSAQSASYKSG